MKKFKRIRVNQDEPVISIRDNRFYYNSILSKLAELKDKKFVCYYIDEEKMEIGFKFFIGKEGNDLYRLGKESNKKNNFRSSASAIISRYNWVNKIHNSRDNDLKKFIARKRKEKWVIKLRPCFENFIAREDLKSLSDETTGIYRYLNKQQEIVYIGKGNIKRRAKQQERRNWDFDKIEFSIIENEKDQYYWEDFWIENFKKKHNGKLPYYNIVSGNKKTHYNI